MGCEQGQTFVSSAGRHLGAYIGLDARALIETYPKTVSLRDGTNVSIRALTNDDLDLLLDFLQGLEEKDHVFLRYDVHDHVQTRKWIEELDCARILLLGAMHAGRMVGGGALRIRTHEWTRHVGQIRLVTAKPHRRKGLGGYLLRELVALAEERDLEKLQAFAMENDEAAMKLGQAFGFEVVAVLEGMIKDRRANSRNVVIMVNEVVNLTQTIEDWIQESTLPGYRAPGCGA